MNGPPLLVSLEATDDAHVTAAVQLLADAMPPVCSGLVAYHATGYARFLTHAIELPPSSRTTWVRILTVDGQVVAVADWRIVAESLFLNGFIVRAGHRGRGHARQLLRDGVSTARRLGLTALTLDVDTDNSPARRLYHGFGFRDDGYAAWTELPATDPVVVRARIVDWASFRAHHDAYGFGDLQLLAGDGGPTRARVIGTVVRVEPGPGGRHAAALLAGLVGGTRAYCVQSGPHPRTDVGFAHFARMSLRLSQREAAESRATGSRRAVVPSRFAPWPSATAPIPFATEETEGAAADRDPDEDERRWAVDPAPGGGTPATRA